MRLRFLLDNIFCEAAPPSSQFVSTPLRVPVVELKTVGLVQEENVFSMKRAPQSLGHYAEIPLKTVTRTFEEKNRWLEVRQADKKLVVSQLDRVFGGRTPKLALPRGGLLAFSIDPNPDDGARKAYYTLELSYHQKIGDIEILRKNWRIYDQADAKRCKLILDELLSVEESFVLCHNEKIPVREYLVNF
jgi:hypothetical protein